MSKANDSIMTRIGQDLETAKVRNSRALELQVNSNCWICEGWTQVYFEYEPGKSDDSTEPHDPFVPIKLHLDIDQYKGDLMIPKENDQRVYHCYRMLPPGTHQYFFTVGTEIIVALDQQKTNK